MEQKRFRANSHAILGLWSHWAVSAGALAGTLFCALFVPKLWLPAVVLAFQFVLMARVRLIRERDAIGCAVMPYLVARILFFSAIIMVAINFYYLRMIPDEIASGMANPDIPYITILVLGPVSLVVFVWAYVRGDSMTICKDCHARRGIGDERGFIGKILSRESKFQMRMFMTAAVMITVYTWAYYLWHYSNVNFNSADVFFYIWIPIILYVLSLVNLGIRYLSINAFYHQNIAVDANMHDDTTLMRYIILCGDRIYLNVCDEDDSRKVDTPAQRYISFRERVSEYDAVATFRSIAGASVKPAFRFLYENADMDVDCNIFHYICVFDSMSETSGLILPGDWYTQNELRNMVEARRIAPMLMSEIDRLYTVIMAFKTYDSSGRRLYDIKHYKPSFRLRDIANLIVDYNDPQWLYVAKDNEDKPFYNFKRFWRRYVRGISM